MSTIQWNTTTGSGGNSSAAQTMPAVDDRKPCGCNKMQQRAKMVQLLSVVAYLLLIVYLFKAITK